MVGAQHIRKEALSPWPLGPPRSHYRGIPEYILLSSQGEGALLKRRVVPEAVGRGLVSHVGWGSGAARLVGLRQGQRYGVGNIGFELSFQEQMSELSALMSQAICLSSSSVRKAFEVQV